MKRKIIITISTLNFLIFSCVQKDETSELYSDIINNIELNENVIIIDSTLVHDNDILEFSKFELYKKEITKLEKATFDDFVIKNKSPNKISNNFSTNKKITFLSKSELKYIFERKKGWKYIDETYGENPYILSFSLPGFNADKTQALLYHEMRSSPRSGYRVMFLYKKINDKWIIDETLPLAFY